MDKNAAAVVLWREQETEMKGRIHDNMRDDDVNSSRRREACQHAVASTRLRPQLPD